MSDDMIIYALGGLCFLVIAGVGVALTGGGGNASKRAKELAKGGSANAAKQKGGKGANEAAKRNKQTQQMLAKLREENQKRKSKVSGNDPASLIRQAGLDMSVQTFWIISVVTGLMAGLLVLVSGAGINGATVRGIMIPGPLLILFGALAGFLGLPRWVLGMLKARRAKKLTNQFADAIDIIVRGVKSGLPLTECLRIIAKESPDPLGSEFAMLTDNISMGTTMDRALKKFYERVPLPEVNFFVIVLTIQAKSGGNLSEALGNLSAIIRSRKMMREKIKAMSSEAKASAGIIAALPFAVTIMVYFTTPDYISMLWTTSQGHMILAMAAGLMFTGVMVMRRMINFDI